MKNKATIVITTYNHEEFISQAIDSLLAQKTNFDFEIIIADDASTDRTAEIIKEYAKKYPSIITPILREKNIGAYNNYIETLSKIKGQYVIMNEGDDYFIDENKLQKQVDFLDNNPDFAICFHPVKVVWQDKSADDSVFPSPNIHFNKEILTIDDLLKHNFIQTNSCMYRWRFHKDNILELMPNNILPGDYFLHLLHAQTGKIGMLKDIMSVYRRHQKGLWAGAGKNNTWFIKCGLLHINFYNEVEKSFNVSKMAEKLYMGNKIIISALESNRFDIIQKLSSNNPELYQQLITRLKEPNIKPYKKYKKRFKAMSVAFLIVLIALIIALIT